MMDKDKRISWAVPGRIWFQQAVYGSFLLAFGIVLFVVKQHFNNIIGMYFLYWLLMTIGFLVLTLLVFVGWAQWFKYRSSIGGDNTLFISVMRAHFQLILAIGIWGIFVFAYFKIECSFEGFAWVHFCYAIGLEIALKVTKQSRIEANTYRRLANEGH